MSEKYRKPQREANIRRPEPEIRRDVQYNSGHPHWSDVDGDELQHFIEMVCDYGACVIMSRSADGGVLSLTVISGNDRLRAYARSGDEMLRHFTSVLEELS